MVRGQTAQVRGTDNPRRVPHRLRVDIEGGHEGPQLIGDVDAALTDDVLGGNGVYRNARLGHGSRLGPAADDDHPLFELRRHDDIQRRRARDADRHAAAHLRDKAGKNERHVVGAGLERGKGERAGAVGDDAPHRSGAGCVARLHGYAGQDEARRIRDGSGQRPVLAAPRAFRRRGKVHAGDEAQDDRRPRGAARDHG